MTWVTSKPSVWLRTCARRVGLTRLGRPFVGRADYEAKFRERMMGRVYSGAVVWDIGANVGYYTRQFSAAVGKDGQVVAIEPNPSALAALKDNLEGLQNIIVVPAALGEREDVMALDPGVHAQSPTARLVRKGGAPSDGSLDVRVTTGDNLVRTEHLRYPNLIKIDTEGHELDVLNGMRTVLGHRALAAVCVEIHFRLLAERGASSAPAEIETMLKEAGLSIEWTDLSHLVALRRSSDHLPQTT